MVVVVDVVVSMLCVVLALRMPCANVGMVWKGETYVVPYHFDVLSFCI